MKNTCKTCGRSYRIEPPYVDGQEISCPYCGATNVYHTPSRIDLPVDANLRSRQDKDGSVLYGRDQKIASTGERGEDTASTMQPVSRLHVIRPSAGAAQAAQSEKDNALVERVRDRARSEWRKKCLKKIGVVLKDLFWILVLAAIVLGGWKIFFGKRPQTEVRVYESEPEKPEVTPVAEKPVVPIESKPDVVPEKPVRTKQPELALHPADILNSLKGAKVSFYGLLPASERLGAADGVFAVVIPYGDKVSRCYGVLSSPTGAVAAIRCDKVDTSTGEYEKELQRQGGFVVRTGVAYYVTRPNSPKSWNPPMSANEDFCASKAYFGIAHELVRKQGWRTDDLRFDITIVFGNPKGSVPIATVRFGEKTYFSSFRKAAEPLARQIRSRDLPRPKPKTYRLTVVYSDGPLIGSNLKGVTKVPRHSQYEQGPEYLRWLKLSEEAERQEREYRRVLDENDRRVAEWKRQLEAPVTDDEIRKVLMASSVKIARKREGEK